MARCRLSDRRAGWRSCRDRVQYLVLAVAAVGVDGIAYTVVTKVGRRITTQGAPEYENGKAHLRMVSGTIVIPEMQVDKEATRVANLGQVADGPFREPVPDLLDERHGVIACSDGGSP